MRHGMPRRNPAKPRHISMTLRGVWLKKHIQGAGRATDNEGMNKFTLPILAFVSVGCATIAPPDVRKASFVEKTSQTKSASFNRALAYLAKNMGDSNSAIKLKDPESARIVVKMNSPCNAIRPWGDFMNNYSASYTADFQAKDKRFRLNFEDVHILVDQTGALAGTNISGAKEMDKVKSECLSGVVASLKSAIDSGGGSDW